MKDIIFRDLPLVDIRNIQKDIAVAIHPATLSPDQTLVQVADLPFYDTFKLYAVTDLRLPSESAYELLCGPSGAFLLDGKTEPVFRVNQMAPLRLSPETIIPYIKFFFHYTDNGMGRYSVAETVDDIPFLQDTDEDEMAEAASLLEPAAFKAVDEKGLYTCTATLLFHDWLYRSDIKVASIPMEIPGPDPQKPVLMQAGEIQLANEEELLQDMNVPITYLSDHETEGLDPNEKDLLPVDEFEPYDTLPKITGIELQEQDPEAAVRILTAIAPELLPSPVSKAGFILHTTRTPFYPDLDLCALTDPDAPSPNIYFFLMGPDPAGGIIPMDKTNEYIYGLNEKLSITLTPETLISYAKFFFFMVRGIIGRFIIVEKPEEVVWLPKATKKEKAAVAALLMPVTFEGLDTEGLYSLKATVIFRNALFRTDIKVAPRAMDVFDNDLNDTEPFVLGQMKLTNEDLLLEDLNVPFEMPGD